MEEREGEGRRGKEREGEGRRGLIPSLMRKLNMSVSEGGKTKNMYFYIFMVEKTVIWCIVTTKIFNKIGEYNVH